MVELEISLDETREQYSNVLRNSNSKAQQRKMDFLARNLDQLTLVQRQLVEQNTSLKKEVALAERKLLARNERIQSLDTLLQDANERLQLQQQKFDEQYNAFRRQIEAARTGTLSFRLISSACSHTYATPTQCPGRRPPAVEGWASPLVGSPSRSEAAAPPPTRRLPPPLARVRLFSPISQPTR